ncbi:MAG: hypothetical protein ABIN58_10840 [candidate division WOR-3 bacterium]
MDFPRNHDSYDAQRLSAQCKGVEIAGRRDAHGKESGEAIDLVCKRHDDAQLRLWQRAARTHGQIVFFDGAGNFF